jgi:hypothetical protein
MSCIDIIVRRGGPRPASNAAFHHPILSANLVATA